MKENAQAIANIIQAVQRLGLIKEEFQTIEYRIDILYDYDQALAYAVQHAQQKALAIANALGVTINHILQ